jgi:hypothetical protein
MTDWCWFALVDGELSEPLAGPVLASAQATSPAGAAQGMFVAWPAGRKPVPDALRMDARLVDPEAPGAWVSLVIAPRSVALLFDDVAVSEAMRKVLRGVSRTAVSTLVRDATTLAGAVTVSRDAGPETLRDDPFVRLYPGRVLRAGPGLFAECPAPPGPAIQRYAGKPWPLPGFENAAPLDR